MRDVALRFEADPSFARMNPKSSPPGLEAAPL